MNELTTTELEQLTLNLRGFTSPEMISVLDKIGAELARREELDPKPQTIDKVAALLAD